MSAAGLSVAYCDVLRMVEVLKIPRSQTKFLKNSAKTIILTNARAHERIVFDRVPRREDIKCLATPKARAKKMWRFLVSGSLRNTPKFKENGLLQKLTDLKTPSFWKD